VRAPTPLRYTVSMSQWRYKKRKQHIVVVGLVAVVLATLTFIVMRDNGLRFLDGVNLIFHEAGHLIFFFLPGILVAFAGTFVQLAVPIACVAHFLGRGARVAALVALWWVGESLVNVSIYIADARVQVLPLLGNGEHDWAYILGTLGVLEYDTPRCDDWRNGRYRLARTSIGTRCTCCSLTYSLLKVKPFSE